MENAVEAGNAKAAMAKQAVGGLSERQVQELESVQLMAQANALAEMEASHNASLRKLLAELDAVRQQKAAAEEHAIRANHLVSYFFLFCRTLWAITLVRSTLRGRVGGRRAGVAFRVSLSNLAIQI